MTHVKKWCNRNRVLKKKLGFSSRFALSFYMNLENYGGLSTMPKISYAQAGTDALIEEMKRDPTTFHLATSAADELVNEFGSERVRATPIAEGAFTGIAIGAAGSGYRPIINWGMITFFPSSLWTKS